MRFPLVFRLKAAAAWSVALLSVGSLAAPTLAAAQPKKAQAGDAPPVLMSRTGGGSAWASVQELRTAAEKGDSKAQAQFGEVLLRGEEGVPQDRPRAIAMLEQAARAGEASAAFRIGMLLDDGDGMPRDRARALEYFRAAAAGGAVEALHNIGAAYASARGVKRDYGEGLAWLMLAKKRGSESPAEAAVRAQILKLRQPELISAAEKRAAEIERELAQKKVTDLLPPPIDTDTSASKGEPAVALPKPPTPIPQVAPLPVATPKIEPPKVAVPPSP